MSVPFYVSPEQMMKDRADFARKGIARGRSVITARYRDGIVFIAQNPSHTLHKVSEIHDRIGFAAVGRYHEFESLRVAGVRQADLRGYAYDGADVSARALANAYAQLLGTAFSAGTEKPFEVELVVAQIGDISTTERSQGSINDRDRLYRINFDGSVFDEPQFVVIGGHPEPVEHSLRDTLTAQLPLAQVIRHSVSALREAGSEQLSAGDLEIAVLDRNRVQPRKFKRLESDQIRQLLKTDS